MGYFEVEALSNSKLNLIDPEMGGSPLEFAEGFNQDEFGPSYSLEMGDALHKMILEPELFITADFYRPTDNMIKWAEAVEKLGGVTDANILKGRELSGTYANLKDPAKLIKKFEDEGGVNWVQFIVEGKGKIVLKPEDYFKLNKAAEAVSKHPRSQDLLSGENEKEIYFNYLGMKCKCKLDNIKIIPEENLVRIVDLKSTSKNPARIQNFVHRYRTYRQLGFYGEGAKSLPEVQALDNPKFEYYVIQAGLAPPNRCVVGQISDEWIAKGLKEIEGLVERVKFADKNGWDHSMEEYTNNYILTLNAPDEE